MPIVGVIRVIRLSPSNFRQHKLPPIICHFGRQACTLDAKKINACHLCCTTCKKAKTAAAIAASSSFEAPSVYSVLGKSFLSSWVADDCPERPPVSFPSSHQTFHVELKGSAVWRKAGRWLTLETIDALMYNTQPTYMRNVYVEIWNLKYYTLCSEKNIGRSEFYLISIHCQNLPFLIY